MPANERLDVQEQGDVTIVRLRDSRIADPTEIETLGRQLYQVLEVKNTSKMVVDFELVDFLSSSMIGKLISLNRKVKICKASLRLCNLQPPIRDIFHLCNLERVFDIRDSLPAAVASPW